MRQKGIYIKYQQPVLGSLEERGGRVAAFAQQSAMLCEVPSHDWHGEMECVNACDPAQLLFQRCGWRAVDLPKRAIRTIWAPSDLLHARFQVAAALRAQRDLANPFPGIVYIISR